jgi:hypothetical protein
MNTYTRTILINKLLGIVELQKRLASTISEEKLRLAKYDVVRYDHPIRLFYTKNAILDSINHYQNVLLRIELYYQNTLTKLNTL